MRWRLSERGNKIKHCGKRETGTMMVWIRKISYIAIFCRTFHPVLNEISEWWNIVVKVDVLKTFFVISRLRSGIQYTSDGDIVLLVNHGLLRWGHYCLKRVGLIIQAKWVIDDMRSDSIAASAFDVFLGFVCRLVYTYISNCNTLWRVIDELPLSAPELCSLCLALICSILSILSSFKRNNSMFIILHFSSLSSPTNQLDVVCLRFHFQDVFWKKGRSRLGETSPRGKVQFVCWCKLPR